MYTISDFKNGKVVIDYRKVPDLQKLRRIVKAAKPKTVELPAGGGDIYLYRNGWWDSLLYEEFNAGTPRCTVNEIQL